MAKADKKVNIFTSSRNFYLLLCLALLAGAIIIQQIITDDYISDNTMIDFIRNHGYQFESHYVTTKDGYILNLHRIPSGRTGESNGHVVLLQHGLWTCSMQWVIAGPEKSLAFILADQGYDVWMGNDRGNTYSRHHTSLNVNDYQFWNYTWHEIGIYDLPASIDYILQHTNRSQIFYIGQSQGSTAMYVMLSSIPEYNKKLKTYISMAPVVYMTNLKSKFLRVPAGILKMVQDMVNVDKTKKFILTRRIFVKMITLLCSNNIGEIFCHKMYFALFGPSPTETNRTLIPLALQHIVGGGSAKQMIHFIQGINSGHFQQYDYRAEVNLLKYGQSTPPDYDLNKVTVPGYLIYSKNDYLADYLTDVPRLCNALPNCTDKILIPVPEFNHIDYLIGKHADSIVHPIVLKLLSKHNSLN